MTAIPIGLHTGDNAKDIARSILALHSVVSASPATAVDTIQGVAAFAVNLAVLGWQEAFSLAPDPTTKSKCIFKAQLPYSPRIWSAYQDMRKAIQPLPSRPGTVAAFIAVATVAVPQAAHLEQYLFDRCKQFEDQGGSIVMAPAIEPVTKRLYLRIEGTLPLSVDGALSGNSTNQGNG